jgi:hypothetical protein
VRELSLHILDVVENSLAAGASHIFVEVEEDTVRDQLVISVADDGCGMDQETARRALDPFFTTRTTRHVGLGLPLLKAAAERCNGHLKLASSLGEGTKVIAVFQRSHIDRAPLGDLVETLMSILLSDRLMDLHYVHTVDGRRFEFCTTELHEILGDIPLSHPMVRDWLHQYVEQGEHTLDQARRQPAGRLDAQQVTPVT